MTPSSYLPVASRASWLRLTISLTLVLALTMAAFGLSTPRAVAEEPTVTYNETFGRGGGKNIVKVNNRADDTLRVRGSIQLNRIPGPTVGPVNLASGYSSCIDSRTLPVALPVNVISHSTNRVTPQNAAFAINEHCTGCQTMAIAIQVVRSVDNPAQVPPDVRLLIREMDRELKAIQADRSLTLDEALARVQAVIDQFYELVHDITVDRQ
jgi:hypothetical protein